MSAATRLPDHAAEVRAHLTSIPALLDALGLTRMREGHSFKIRCLWHGDNSPSCSVRLGAEGTVQVHCFACGFRGNALHLIAAVHRLTMAGADFRRVLDIGASIAGIRLDCGRAGVLGDGAMVASAPAPASDPQPRPSRPDLGTFHRQVSDLLDACPLDGSVGVGLVFRGLFHEADTDGWGELPANRCSACPEQDARAGFDTEDMAADRLLAQLAAARLSRCLPWLVRNGRLAYPQHRLLIPWRTPQGQVWMLQRRWAPVFGDEPATGEDGGKYREDARAECPAYPYGIDAAKVDPAAEVWLVEGAADVLAVRALARAGVIPGSVAPLGLPGVSAWGRVRHAVLPLVEGRSVVIATDSDAAGDNAVASMVGDLWGAGAEEVRRRRVIAPWKDWAEVARAHAERKLS